MKIAFISNFINHHQMSFCQALYDLSGGNFTFIATTPVSRARLEFGYADMNRKYPFVLRAYDGEIEKQKAMSLAEEVDVVIHGAAPWEYLEERLNQKKLTFLYSERLYKSGYEAWKLPVRLLRFWKKYGRHRSLYLLCASAYTAGDFAKTRTFLNKTYKWGYFPETRHYEDVDALLESKEPTSILWAARFIDWKHPEYVLEVARRLKAGGYDFRIQMLGNGVRWESIREQIFEMNLQDRIELTGAIPAEQVRSYMEAASIFLFTSDRNEGWGAVLNESMNSGCAVVADSDIGAVPFLVEDGVNGMTYATRQVDQLYEKVKYLLDHPEAGKAMGRKAYETVTGQWNAETAADRLLNLSRALLQGQQHPQLYESGPCSRAEILKD